MKVLFTNEAPVIVYGLAQGFLQEGHQVWIMQGADRLWDCPEPEQASRLARAIAGFKPDFVFTEGYPGFSPEVICEVCRVHGVPHLYWAIEDPLGDRISRRFAPLCDYIFTTAVECLPGYTSMGKKAEVLLFGCNPLFHRYTGVSPEYAYDIVLVASNYPVRYKEAQWFVMPLVKAHYNIKIWGLWWDNPELPVNLCQFPGVYGGLLPYELLPRVYSSARIILGMNCDDSSITQTSMRPYEALACGGGLYLGHYTRAQEAIFGDLIFQARNTTETLALVDHILQMPEAERRTHAKRAQQEVYARHSYRLRARQIVEAFRSL